MRKGQKVILSAEDDVLGAFSCSICGENLDVHFPRNAIVIDTNEFEDVFRFTKPIACHGCGRIKDIWVGIKA